MRQRIITAIVFAAAMLGGVFGGKHSFFILFSLITAGCAWELLGLLLIEEDKFKQLRQWLGSLLVLSFFLLFAGDLMKFWYLIDTFGATFFLLYAFVFGAASLLELFLGSKNPFKNIGHYQLAIAYIAVPFILLSRIATYRTGWCHAGTPDFIYFSGRVFGLLLLIWTNDTMAYFIGSQLGRRKLFERISPKKTWEGTIGGGICTVLVAWGLSFFIKDFSQTQWLALGAVAAVFGTLGDLVESMLKRSVGVKDSGNLLPGHGGLLDRFDAFIFALPFFWLALQIFKS